MVDDRDGTVTLVDGAVGGVPEGDQTVLALVADLKVKGETAAFDLPGADVDAQYIVETGRGLEVEMG